jgi:hypothetical protein
MNKAGMSFQQIVVAVNAEAVRLMARAGRAAPNNSGAMAQAKAFFIDPANFPMMSADTRLSARWIGIWNPPAYADNLDGYVACDEGLFLNGRQIAK